MDVVVAHGKSAVPRRIKLEALIPRGSIELRAYPPHATDLEGVAANYVVRRDTDDGP